MSNTEVVANFISKSKGHKYCDDCLSEVLDIKPRQRKIGFVARVVAFREKLVNVLIALKTSS